MPLIHLRTRRPAATLGILAILVALLTPIVTATPAHAAPILNPTWTRDINRVQESSPVVANLDGQPDIVVGTIDNSVWAIHASDGSTVGGWPAGTTSPVASSPAVADTNGDGAPEVFIGAGTDYKQNGGFYSFNANGSVRYRFQPTDGDNGNLSVFSSPAIGDINRDNVADVTWGALGLQMWSLSESGGVNGGWPFYTDDTVFSSPALADVNGDGQTDVVIGGDATPGGPTDHDGGVLRAISGDGHELWHFFTDFQIIRSSPAIGDIDGDGRPEIIFGTGNAGTTGGDNNKLIALNFDGSLKWKQDLGGQTPSSPALADVNGDGVLDVVEGTFTNPRIWAFAGNGVALPGWNGVGSAGGAIVGGITTADFNGDGAQDLLVPTGAGFYAYDGKTAAPLFELATGTGFGFQNSAYIGDVDGNGKLDIIIAGNNGSTGRVFRYELAAPATLGRNAWPMFHHDPRRTGNVDIPPLTQTLCGPPGTGGYWMTASDGGIFAFCDAKFFGSTGGIKLNQPIVGMAPTVSGNGYWLVARDGGIFSFGDATFKGSTGSIVLNKPIVGMARTPTGNGYWMVASDGGIFAFGDAAFKGSTGSITLNQPIVAMAATPSGNGYWLIARDGGVFAFGDAAFQGSTGGITLNQPIVGATATPSGNGYWMVASDGGIFAFGDAVFKGSTGSIKLNKPIVGMARNPKDIGYWLVASDGGVFAFNAGFFGSTGSLTLAQPIVTMAAPG